MTFAITRREAIIGGLAGAAVMPMRALAVPGQMEAAIRRVVGETPVRRGKVTLDLPPLVENGNSVPMTVTVASPMNAQDRVKAIHVFNEKNPQANVISVEFGPRAGKAQIATRIRLADTQKITAIAVMADGTCWSDTQDVVVTLAACLEDLQP
jgi:sulfur-oxidizing protein SoxY